MKIEENPDSIRKSDSSPSVREGDIKENKRKEGRDVKIQSSPGFN